MRDHEHTVNRMDQLTGPPEPQGTPTLTSFTFWALWRVDSSSYALRPYLQLYPEMSVLHLPTGPGVPRS